MRGGKDGGNVTSPMFPRLHVNDTDRGGPRAPPRNKMALYEQLSIPTQRLGSGSPSNGSSLVPSKLSSNDGGNERSVFTQFCNSPAPSLLAEKLHSYSSSGAKPKTMMTNQELKSMKPANYQSFNATGSFPSTAKRCSFKPSSFSNFRNFSLKKLGDENNLRAPTSAQTGVVPPCSKDRKYKLKRGSGPGDLKSRPYVKNQNEESARVSQTTRAPEGNSTSIPLSRERNLTDTASSLSPKVKHSESLKRAHSSLNQENRSSLVDILNGLRGSKVLKETARDMDKENSFKKRTETCLRPLFGDNNSRPSVRGNGRECHEDENGRSNDRSALAISPDDVVEVIGENQFWKARRAIIDQQRVFAVQVFELHRLMKVQRLIAQSPNLLLEDNLCTEKPPLNVPQMKRLRSESDLEPAPRIVKAKDRSQKTDLITEFEDENAVANLPHLSVNNDTSKGIVTQRSNYGSYSGNEPTASTVKNIKPSPWCLPPPGNQWLVSVMSPSEGLVYKPYTGPCPPPAGFVAPFYGNCGPMNLTPAGGGFLNTAYGVLGSHQQGVGILSDNPPLGQTYFPPYGMPVMNPSISGSAVEQMSPFQSQPNDNNLSMVDINFMIPHPSSRNMSSQMSRVISRCLGKVQASKESEVQGSTASSPSERAKGDALPLFPMEPIVQASDQNAQTSEQQTRVIKVVPHNRRLATESAARIFQSIQEERKQYD